MPSLMKDIQEADVHGEPLVADMAGSKEGVDVPATELTISMVKRLRLVDLQFSKLEQSTIRRVPPNLREGDRKAYDPQVLSIGPYHRGKPNLEPMEEHKWRYLHNLVTRNLRATSSEMSSELQRFINTAGQWEARARACYTEATHLASDEFVEMMVLDSCFILELLIKFYVRAERKDDPLFAVAWMLPLIRRDLLKLENQIPFFLLEELFALFPQSSKTTPFPLPALKEMAFAYLVWRKCPDPAVLSGLEVHHLLHFYDWVLLPTPPSPVTYNSKPRRLNLKRTWRSLLRLSLLSLSILRPRFKKSTERWRSLGTIPCAAELRRAGIKFRQRSAADNFLDIRLRGRVLEIPRLAVVDGTNSIFRNLIAFEQCFSDGGNPLVMKHFTSYALFMDCIIDTPRDVQILEKQGIIENKLGSDEDVVLLFNQLCKEVIISYEKHHFADLFKIVNTCYGSKLHKSWARKRR